MIIIAFEKKYLAGGLGDRIVGIISCYMISKLLDKEFYILWNKENVHEYIDYSKYDFEKLNNKKINFKEYYLIDKQEKIKEYLLNSDNIFSDKFNKFYLNQEISNYLYSNKKFSKNNFYNDILNTYKILYTEILKPTDSLKLRINNYTKNKNNIIGIQIRAGDKYMITNKSESHSVINDPEKEIVDILTKIKLFCDKDKEKYIVFITSDYNNIYNLSLKVWNCENIIYVNDVIQHLDRDSINTDISKIFIDSYILSQSTKKLFISKRSNFGRIAALTSNHDNLYDIFTNKIYKKNLLSKGELII